MHHKSSSTLHHPLLSFLPSKAARECLAQRLIPPSLRFAHARRDLFQSGLEVLNEHHHASHILLCSCSCSRSRRPAAHIIHLLERAQRTPKPTDACLAHKRPQIST